MFRATRSSRQSSDYHDFALSSVFRATDQPPTRSALLTHVHRKGTSLAKGSSQPHTLFSAGGFPARSFRESAYASLRRGRIVSGRRRAGPTPMLRITDRLPGFVTVTGVRLEGA